MHAMLLAASGSKRSSSSISFFGLGQVAEINSFRQICLEQKQPVCSYLSLLMIYTARFVIVLNIKLTTHVVSIARLA